MEARTTPLGFLSSDIEVHSHCMYTYSKQDELFVSNVVAFLTAGLSVGEMGVCMIDGPVRSEIAYRLAQHGIKVQADPDADDAECLLCSPSDAFLQGGMFDASVFINWWEARMKAAQGRWNGVREFADVGQLLRNRTARLKLLEIEALVNRRIPTTISLCAYQTGMAGRSFMALARNAHPFVANGRSIRRNPTYVGPARFLAAFYRFRRVSKVYPALVRQADTLRSDLVEVAGRTPLSMPEIEDLCTAVGGLFVHMVERGGSRYADDLDGFHLHVTFTAESDKMLVTIRDHARGVRPIPPEVHEHGEKSDYVLNGLIDELAVESWKDDVIATVVKRYRSPHVIGG